MGHVQPDQAGTSRLDDTGRRQGGLVRRSRR